MTRAIIDTGPLVAYFNARDRWHKWVVDQLRQLEAPLVTCEPVLTEASLLIHRAVGRPADLIQKLDQGVTSIGIDIEDEAATLTNLLKRYEDTPMSIADACLVRLSERLPDSRVFTLDSDFEHYRRNSRQIMPIIIPSSWRPGYTARAPLTAVSAMSSPRRLRWQMRCSRQAQSNVNVTPKFLWSDAKHSIKCRWLCSFISRK